MMAWKEHGPGGCCCNECCQTNGPLTLRNYSSAGQWTITANDAAETSVAAGNNWLHVAGDFTPLASGPQTIYEFELEANGTIVLLPPFVPGVSTIHPGWVLDFANQRIYQGYVQNPSVPGGAFIQCHKPIPCHLPATVTVKLARRLAQRTPADPYMFCAETLSIDGVWVATRWIHQLVGWPFAPIIINTNQAYSNNTIVSPGGILYNGWSGPTGAFPGVAAISNMRICASRIPGTQYASCEEVPIYNRWLEGGEAGDVTAVVSGAVAGAANGSRTATLFNPTSSHQSGFRYAPAEGSQISLGTVTIGPTDYDVWLASVSIGTSQLGPLPQGAATITVRFRISGIMPPPPNDFCTYVFLRTDGFERQIPNQSLADLPLTFGFGDPNTDFIYASPIGLDRVAVLDAAIGRGVKITFSQ